MTNWPQEIDRRGYHERFIIYNMTQMSCNFKKQSKIRKTGRIPLCEGGGSKMATQARLYPPSWRNFPQNLQVCHLTPPRDWPASARQGVACGGGGGKSAISSNTLQIIVILRNLFYKIEVQSLPLPYFNVKVCLPSFLFYEQ
jgi:hypothetical protein